MWTPDELLTALRTKMGHPATANEILRVLRVPRELKPGVRRRLRAMVADGLLIETRGGQIGVPDLMDLVVGRITVHPDGYAFVEPERKVEDLAGDLFVAGMHVNEAMHGDRVLARVERRQAGGRAEGRVLRVLERRSATVVGRFDVDNAGLRYVTPFDRRLTQDVQIPRGDDRGAAPGEMVTVDITRWPTSTRGPLGRVIEVLGDIDAPGVDLQVVIRKHGLPDVHADDAIAEAVRLGAVVRPRDIEGRTDFRGWPTVTIDGEHARDFDDAITLSRLPNGNHWLGVHIADVSHYVAEGTALDRDARERATSVYFPERALHMFPAELATGLCSLNPHVDRLVQSCLMEVDRRGAVVRAEFHDGVIHSDARMTYTEVNAILTDRDEALRAARAPLVPMFEDMHALFGILNQRRRTRGSIDFDLPEAEVQLDPDGAITSITASERNVAHRIIEEFMLLANETVAEHLDRHEAPSLYRIHERPDVLKVAEFEAFVSSFGYSLAAPPEAVEPHHFQRVIERMRGTPEERPIATLMLRSMQKARYDAANLGHFGLAARSYTHFTSPIRRYPDLVVHRALRAQRHRSWDADEADLRADEMPELARHTSDRERRAIEAERELLQWKQVRFMRDKVGEDFDGIILGVAPFGLFVQLSDHFIDGLVHVSSMNDDYYRFVEGEHLLFGEATRRRYKLGDKVRVQVVKVDRERRQIELALTDILEAAGGRRRGGPASRAVKSGVSSKRERRQVRTRSQRPGKHERAMKKRGR